MVNRLKFEDIVEEENKLNFLNFKLRPINS
jgi:hypothetical protein